MNSNIIDHLRESGYMLDFPIIEGKARPQIIGARLDYLVTDYATDQRQYFREPTVSVCVLEFEAEDASPLSTKFIAELLKLVAPADRVFKKHARPLVRTTANTLHAIYQADNHYAGLYDKHGRELYQLGFTFADADQFSTARLRAACGRVPLDGGAWLNDATPHTVKRDTLPMWDRDAMTPKLCAFVDKFIAAGEMREREPYTEPPSRPPYEYGDVDISVDPNDWDPTDPRRFSHGLADKVRKLRREALGREPKRGELIHR